MIKLIDNFEGEYDFLSNFYNERVFYDGKWWHTSEHAYQAAKTNDPKEKYTIECAATPYIAKKRGRSLTLRKDWESAKIQIMREIVMSKFINSPELARKLIETGDAKLVEGNWWGDKFWGSCNGVGQNWLGKILMEVRSYLIEREKSKQE